jgi:hypothetical protein
MAESNLVSRERPRSGSERVVLDWRGLADVPDRQGKRHHSLAAPQLPEGEVIFWADAIRNV